MVIDRLKVLIIEILDLKEGFYGFNNFSYQIYTSAKYLKSTLFFKMITILLFFNGLTKIIISNLTVIHKMLKCYTI
jgi:hypothetical protein